VSGALPLSPADRADAASDVPWRWPAIAAFWLAWGVARLMLGDEAWLHLAARCWWACTGAELMLHLLATRFPRWPLFVKVPLSFLSSLGYAYFWGKLVPRISADKGVRDLAIAAGLALLVSIPPLVQRWRAKRQAQARLHQAEAQAQLAALTRDKALAELNLLQAQVEPHFLYNTLAAMQYLIRHDPAQAALMMDRLHDYLRQSLPAMRSPMSTLGREFALADSYLTLMRLRLGDRLRFSLDLPEDLADVPVPPMMLGTLIENAVKHGIEPQPAGGEIVVLCRRQSGGIEMVVEDDGVGLGGDPRHPTGSTSGTGLGLDNLRERLRAMWPESARLEVANRPSAGVRAWLWWPEETR